MTKTITLDFSKPNLGIEEAMEQLKQYKEWVERKTDELCKRLAEIGREQAIYEFNSVTTSQDTVVNVEVEQIEKGWKISANGEGIAFIEFGAGTRVKEDILQTDDGGSISNYPGAYSVDHAKQFAEKGRWYYKGQRYTYVTPGNCMLHTSMALHQKVYDIAREVFSHD